MKKNYKYIYFETDDDGIVYYCYNKKHKTLLGKVYYHSDWKQYVYMPENSIYSKECLLDIADYLDGIN